MISHGSSLLGIIAFQLYLVHSILTLFDIESPCTLSIDLGTKSYFLPRVSARVMALHYASIQVIYLLAYISMSTNFSLIPCCAGNAYDYLKL